MFLFKRSVNSILASIASKIDKLLAHAAAEEKAHSVKTEKAQVLIDKANAHVDEAIRARKVAQKIRDLIS